MTALARASKGWGLTGTFTAHGLILLACLLLAEQAAPTPLPPPVEAVRISLAEPVAPPAPMRQAQPEPEPVAETPAPLVEEKTATVVKKADPKPEKPKPHKQQNRPKERAKTATPSPGGPAANSSPPSNTAVVEARQTLLSSLVAKIEKEKRYPRAARRLGLEGQITAVIRVDSQGRIISAGVRGAGSHAILEKATIEALDRVRANWKPVPVPEAMTLHIPIRYTLS